MYAYLHHSAGPAGPFQTVNVDVRRVPNVDGRTWRGHIRSPFQIREPGGAWRNVYRDPISPAWVPSRARARPVPAMYALVEGKRAAVSVRA